MKNSKRGFVMKNLKDRIDEGLGNMYCERMITLKSARGIVAAEIEKECVKECVSAFTVFADEVLPLIASLTALVVNDSLECSTDTTEHGVDIKVSRAGRSFTVERLYSKE